MKILFVTTRDAARQGDLLEICILNGLRHLIGNRCIDYPRKRIMYHDWSHTSLSELHGNGLNMLTYPIADLGSDRIAQFFDFDVVLYGCGWNYGEPVYEKLLDLIESSRIWYLDGHDLYGFAEKMVLFNGQKVIGNQRIPCFKRERIFEENDVYGTGLGIPSWCICPIDLTRKDQLFQSTAPNHALFKAASDLGNRSGYKFFNENDYNYDIKRSWFGLCCLRGGWDSLRIYEIIANGSLLLYRDYDQKPRLCSPQGLPCYSYSSLEELYAICERLVPNGIVSEEYVSMLHLQRTWLINHGTCQARALAILNTLERALS